MKQFTIKRKDATLLQFGGGKKFFIRLDKQEKACVILSSILLTMISALFLFHSWQASLVFMGISILTQFVAILDCLFKNAKYTNFYKIQ